MVIFHSYVNVYQREKLIPQQHVTTPTCEIELFTAWSLQHVCRFEAEYRQVFPTFPEHGNM